MRFLGKVMLRLYDATVSGILGAFLGSLYGVLAGFIISIELFMPSCLFIGFLSTNGYIPKNFDFEDLFSVIVGCSIAIGNFIGLCVGIVRGYRGEKLGFLD